MSERLLSLAAGVVQEFPPEDVVRAAARAGFGGAGLWFDPETWTQARTRAVRDALSDTGLVALDIEVAWLQPGENDAAHERIVDLGAELGARHLLVVSSEPDPTDTRRRFAHLCRRSEGSGLRVVLEFFGFTAIRSLAAALQIARDVDHPAAGVLVDALHLFRTGGKASDLIGVDAALLPYAQLCDAATDVPGEGRGALLDEALNLRLCPGEGALPIGEVLDALPPATPLSLEVRSRALAERFPDDAAGRAAQVIEATRHFLATRA